jgi:WD40 repeat protein
VIPNTLSGVSKTLAAFTRDADTFVKEFRVAISKSAPHIYISAVPLSPSGSMVSRQYASKYPRQLLIDEGRAIDWPSELNVCDDRSDEVNAVAFSYDRKYIVSGSDDGVRVWHANTGAMASRLPRNHVDVANSVVFSHDDKQILSGSDDPTVTLWDAKTSDLVRKFEGHRDVVSSVAFSRDGKYVVSGSFDTTIRVWETATGKPVCDPLEGHGGGVLCVAFSPEGKRIVSASKDSKVRVWRIDMGEPMSTKVFKGHVDEDDFDVFWFESMHSGGDSQDEGIQVSRPLILSGHTDEVNSVDFSCNGSWIVSGSDDCTVRVWDTQTCEVVSGPLNGHTDVVNSVAFSSDGTRVVSGSSDRTIRVWDVQTGMSISGPIYGHTDWVWSVAFSHDGQRIVSGSIDQTIRVWHAEADEVVSWLVERHANPYLCLPFFFG